MKKLYDIKAWLNYITTIMMSDSERDWYIHWMEDYNNTIRNHNNKNLHQ